MKREQIEKYRRRLIELAARLKTDESSVIDEALRQAGSGTSGNLSNVPMHLADMGSDAFEQEMSSSLMSNARQLQIDVADALDRLDKGTFGRCEQCGGDIREGRLQVVPYTRYCRDCAQKAENEGEAGFRPTRL